MIYTQNICWIDKCALLDFMERTAAAFVDTVLITRYAVMLLEFVNRDANPDIKGEIAQKVCRTKVEIQYMRHLEWKSTLDIS